MTGEVRSRSRVPRILRWLTQFAVPEALIMVFTNKMWSVCGCFAVWGAKVLHHAGAPIAQWSA